MKRTTDGSKMHQSGQKMENALEESAGLNWKFDFAAVCMASWVELALENGESTRESTFVDG